jgi:hypothetical protein
MKVISCGGVGVMVNLINDEDDDDLSTKAYQCLEYMGPLTIKELLKELKQILERRGRLWKKGNTIMIDVFMKRERHVCCVPSEKVSFQGQPNLRDFGPQTIEDLML